MGEVEVKVNALVEDVFSKYKGNSSLNNEEEPELTQAEIK